ncbi:ATP-dependent RNA helicase [Nesidiocoris tenuis]|uniref:RNA helicase n=1 Tax=Nesidiocoris tenuis TaxID=355587 RepID=A0ABN7BDR1_9HEMI|nr:ATP-dependent RNA helicase [Nesidiocoris tenuis]
MSYNRRPPSTSSFGQMSRTERAAAVPPPPSAAFSKQGYSTMTAITENALDATWGMPRRRAKTEDEYFEDDEEVNTLEYIPAPGSPGYVPPKNESDDEEDPLDAYMAQVENQVKKDTSKGAKKGVRVDIDDADVEESYFKYMEENPKAGLKPDEDEIEVEYDSDGNPIAPKKKKTIDPLPPIDHATMNYVEFQKDFYQIHDEIANLTNDNVNELRQTLGVNVSGFAPPRPVTSFGHFNFDEQLLKAIRKYDFTQPTPIQAQAVPAILQGRDVIGIAKTGTGKTAAYVWPMVIHVASRVSNQTKKDESSEGKTEADISAQGPFALVLAPTRELSQQIYVEVKKFGKSYGFSTVCAYGGGSKWEQTKALEQGADIVVGTPGRIIDLVRCKAMDLAGVTYLVLDEADRMFDLGFEPQVRSICDHVRPDRQCLLFSATFKKKIENLARDVTKNPVRILYGDYVGEANSDIDQKVIVMLQTNKLPWLLANLVEFQSRGSVLVFVNQKVHAEELKNQLNLKEIDCLLLHGDCDQIERNRVISTFKKKECDILVATDVASRGLDIPHVRTVVNFDAPREISTYTHRIGRTGRAGMKGDAVTLVTSADKEIAGHLVKNLESVGQNVPSELFELACTSSWFKKQRFKKGNFSGSSNVGGAGLGYTGTGPKAIMPKMASEKKTGEPKPTEAKPAEPKAAKSGPGQDRLAAIKSAFRAQYETQFTTATAENAEMMANVVQPKKRKRSRWDD